MGDKQQNKTSFKNSETLPKTTETGHEMALACVKKEKKKKSNISTLTLSSSGKKPVKKSISFQKFLLGFLVNCYFKSPAILYSLVSLWLLRQIITPSLKTFNK